MIKNLLIGSQMASFWFDRFITKTCNGHAVSSTRVLIFWDTDYLARQVEHIVLFGLIFPFSTNLFKKCWVLQVFQPASPQGQNISQPCKRTGTETLTAKVFQEGTRESQRATWEDTGPGVTLAAGLIFQHSCTMEGERLFNYVFGLLHKVGRSSS